MRPLSTNSTILALVVALEPYNPSSNSAPDTSIVSIITTHFEDNYSPILEPMGHGRVLIRQSEIVFSPPCRSVLRGSVPRLFICDLLCPENYISPKSPAIVIATKAKASSSSGQIEIMIAIIIPAVIT